MRIPTLILGLLLTFDLWGQQPLSLDSAISKALSGGNAVLIAQSELTAATLKDYKGNAGELPKSSILLSDNAQLININQELSNGNQVGRNGAVANALGTSFNVNWVVFNGLRVQAYKGAVRANIEQKDQQLRSAMQATVAEVVNTYLDLARQQRYLAVIEQSRLVSEQRLLLIQRRKEVGMANAADLLLAEIDLQDRVNALETQKILIRQLQVDLNNQMQAPLENTWTVNEDFPFGEVAWANIEAGIRANPDLAAAEAAAAQAEFQAKSVYANRMPTLQLNGGVGYNLSMNSGGFILRNQSYGPYVGVNANVPLLQKRSFDREYQAAQQNAETMHLRKQDAEEDLLAHGRKIFDSYAMLQMQVEQESLNVARAQKLLDLEVARERLDASTVLELREAQRSFEEVNFRLIDLKFRMQQAQVELMRLAGLLVE